MKTKVAITYLLVALSATSVASDALCDPCPEMDFPAEWNCQVYQDPDTCDCNPACIGEAVYICGDCGLTPAGCTLQQNETTCDCSYSCDNENLSRVCASCPFSVLSADCKVYRESEGCNCYYECPGFEVNMCAPCDEPADGCKYNQDEVTCECTLSCIKRVKCGP